MNAFPTNPHLSSLHNDDDDDANALQQDEIKLLDPVGNEWQDHVALETFLENTTPTTTTTTQSPEIHAIFALGNDEWEAVELMDYEQHNE